jgi:hypothetical protein
MVRYGCRSPNPYGVSSRRSSLLLHRHLQRQQQPSDIYTTATFGFIGYMFLRLDLDAAPRMCQLHPRF